jgi:prepilin-type N-terminal cleavage/methylation domain-containing protein
MVRINKNLGFTLIEMLVVISSLALLILAGSNLFFASLFGSGKTEAIKEVRQNGEYALKVIEETIKNSYGVRTCVPGNQEGDKPPLVDPPKIVVKDKTNNEITFQALRFTLDDGSEIYRIASISSLSPNSPYYLTSNKVKVGNFKVDCADVQENLPSKISFGFKLVIGKADYTPERKASINFSATVTSRNF